MASRNNWLLNDEGEYLYKIKKMKKDLIEKEKREKMYEKQKYVLDKLLKKVGVKLEDDLDFYIAGGALTSVFSNTKINDLDIFFSHPGDHLKFRDKVFPGKKPSFVTDCAISYVVKKIRIQLIKIFYGEPYRVINGFDYTVCMAAYYPKKSDIILDERFLQHLAAKELHYSNLSEYPFSALWRAGKYIRRGFSFPATEMIKLALAINKLEIVTYRDLKKQLEGIDTILLKPITDILVERADEKFEVTEALLLMDTILGELFDA